MAKDTIRSRWSTSVNLLVAGLAGVFGYGTVAQGGFHWPEAGIFAGGCLSLLLLVWAVQGVPGAGTAPVALCMGCLALALLVAIMTRGWTRPAAMAVSTLTAAGSSFFVVRSAILRGGRSAVLELLALVGTLVALSGLIGLALHVDPWAVKAGGLWRASSTLSYANAAGGLLVLAVPSALLLQVWLPGVVHRAMLYLLLAGLLATLSRGAGGAFLVTVLILGVFGGRDLLSPLVRPALGSLVAFAGLTPSVTGTHGSPLPAAAGLALGAALVLMPVSGKKPSWSGRRIFLGLVVFMIAIAAGAFLVRGPLLSSRLGAGSDARFETWRVTLKAVSRSPIFGIGLGRLHVVYTVGGSAVATRFAHNEFLQVLAETGAVGLSSVLISLGILAAWAWRKRGPGRPRLPWVAGVAASVAFLFQSCLDIMWRFPVLPAMAFAWLAIATVEEPNEGGGH